MWPSRSPCRKLRHGSPARSLAVRNVRARSFLSLVAPVLATLTLSACGPVEEARGPEVRPVRTVTVSKREAGSTVTLTGRIEAQDEAALGFRIGGRVMERPVNVGDRVQPGQIIARLEPQNEMNALR